MKTWGWIQLAAAILGIGCASSPGVLVLNEVAPAGGDESPGWVEVANTGGEEVSLSGWTLVQADGTVVATLPASKLAPAGFLVIELDGGMDWDANALALLNPDGAMVDFVAWSRLSEPVRGPWVERAAAEGHWPRQRYVPTLAAHAQDLTRPVLEGESFGRDALSTDTGQPSDWAPLGGASALEATPGAPNESALLTQLRKDRPQGKKPRDKEPPPAEGPRRWTVMILMDGRDEGLSRAWLKDLQQLAQTGSSAAVAYAVQFYGAGPDRKGSLRWHLQQHHNLNDVEKRQEVPQGQSTDPGEAATLSDFITWAKTTLPAERYALVLAGHGRGWKGTNIWKNGHLDMGELRQGLEALGKPFDAVFFYSCLMGMVEVARQLDERALYMVAGEEVLWAGLVDWKALAADLQNSADSWDGAAWSTALASSYAGGAKKSKNSMYTISVVSPPQVTAKLLPVLNPFATELRNDVEDKKKMGVRDDNAQVQMFEKAQQKAEDFSDSNFKDLFHFAQLIEKLPIQAAKKAPQVRQALAAGGEVVLFESHGGGQPNAHGLSIYFPHAQMKPDRAGPSDDACDKRSSSCQSSRVFDHPEPALHLYKRDAAIKLPRLGATAHALPDDPLFLFPDSSSWDEFLHRFYEPVADGCIEVGPKKYVDSITVEVGDQVTLWGGGSSDIDTDRSQRQHDPERWYWDFDITADIPAPLPEYQEGREFPACTEDCDADESDDLDDDPQGEGKKATFVCPAPGTYQLLLNTWDDHHVHPREFYEDRSHNQGKHWLHFNVHADGLTVTCVDKPTTPRKKASRSSAAPGYSFHYSLWLPFAGPAPAEGAFIIDPLPPEVSLVTQSLSCSPGGACSYDPTTHTVQWLGAEEVVSEAWVAFEVTVRDEVPCPEVSHPPAELINTAKTRTPDGQEAAIENRVALTCPEEWE